MDMFFKKINIRNRDKCYVVDKDILKDINKWIRKVHFRRVKLNDILLDMGFSFDNNINIYGVSIDGNNLLLDYEHAGVASNKMIFNGNGVSLFGKNKERSIRIIVLEDNMERIYKLNSNSEVRKGYDIDFVSDKINLEDDSLSYYRMLDFSSFEIKFLRKKDGKEIKLFFDGCDGIKLFCENELIDYLSRIDFTIGVQYFYKMVREICKINESKFSNIVISFIRDGEVVSKYEYNNQLSLDCFNDISKVDIFTEDKNLSYSRYATREMYLDKYRDELTEDKVNLEFINGRWRFVLFARKINRISFGRVKLNNEDNLKDYLMGLEFPIMIDEVYRKICDILDLELSIYNEIKMVCYDSDILTDIIHLRNGELETFKMTKEGVEYVLDKSEIYECDDELTTGNVKRRTKTMVNDLLRYGNRR